MCPAPDGTMLGRCPLCTAEIPIEQLVVSYEPESGWPRMLAACVTCDEIVRPV